MSRVLRSLVDRESRKVPKFDNAALLRVDLFERAQRRVEVEQVHRRGRHADVGKRDFKAREPRSALGRPAGAGMIDQHGPHHARRDREEVRAILPLLAGLLLGQPNVSLVDDRGGLEGVADAFTTKVPGRYAPQLRIDRLHEAGQCGSVTLRPVVQQAGDLFWRVGQQRRPSA